MRSTMKQIESILLEAVELSSEAERQAFLDSVCADRPEMKREVEQMVADHFGADGFLESPTAGWPTTFLGEAAGQRVGSTIGPYVLSEELGEGGMGIVYVADQRSPIRRQVALKIIKPGMDSRAVIARFNTERQVLALMDHENIARVLDAGSTDAGGPYFVMELIRGRPITEYCDQHRLSIRERLKLFVTVCQAVQHAHQKGVIHRDLKPSNVLVSEPDGKPTPKIIDFGVAKAINQPLAECAILTGGLQLMGTPLYMSPEQAELSPLSVDTRSDIYSLGVLLYELLTGTTPLEQDRLRTAPYDELCRLIREADPPRPSARIHSLVPETAETITTRRRTDVRKLLLSVRGDLDWIVTKCLQKERERRYETANELATDVQRFLQHEPVLASPPSWATGCSKWARRHRAIVVTVGLLTMAIAVGSIVTAVLVAREQAATARALKESEGNERSLKVINEELEKERRRAEDNLRNARAAVDQMLVRVAGELKDVPHLTDLKRAMLEQSLVFYQQFLQQDVSNPDLRYETACIYQRVGNIERALGKDEAAEAAYIHATVLMEELVRQFPADRTYRDDLAMTLGEHAYTLVRSDRQQESIALRARQLAVTKATAEQNPSDPSCWEQVSQHEADLGNAYYAAGYYTQAESHLREGLRLVENVYRDHPQLRKDGMSLAHCQTWLGVVLTDLHQYAEAEQLLRSGIAIYREASNKYPESFARTSEYAWAMHKLAILLNTQGNNQPALKVERQAIELLEKLVDDDPDVVERRWKLGNAYYQLAQILWGTGAPTDAEDALRRAIFQSNVQVTTSPESMIYRIAKGRFHFSLGQLYDTQDRGTEAATEYRQALEAFEAALERFPASTKPSADIATFLATCPAPQFRDPERAIKHARRALQSDSESVESWRVLGISCFQAGDWMASDEAFDRSFALQSGSRDVEDFFYRAIIAWRLGASQDAHRWYQLGLAQWPGPPPALPWIARLRDEASTILGIDLSTDSNRRELTD